MIPQIFQIDFPFPITINSFGLFLALAFIAGMRRLELSFSDHGIDKERAEPMVMVCAVAGVFGAKLLSVLANLDRFWSDPLGTVLSGTGFVFYGGLIGGFLAGVWFAWRNKLGVVKVMDLIGPTLALGYGVGRIGCHLSGDGDYGSVTDLPWSFSYALGVVPTTSPVHPTPIYESLAAFGICWFLLKVERSGALSAPGQRFSLYLLLMSTERFLVEFLRIEPRVFAGFTQAQVIALVLFSIGGILLLFSQTLRPKVSS